MTNSNCHATSSGQDLDSSTCSLAPSGAIPATSLAPSGAIPAASLAQSSADSPALPQIVYWSTGLGHEVSTLEGYDFPSSYAERSIIVLHGLPLATSIPDGIYGTIPYKLVSSASTKPGTREMIERIRLTASIINDASGSELVKFFQKNSGEIPLWIPIQTIAYQRKRNGIVETIFELLPNTAIESLCELSKTQRQSLQKHIVFDKKKMKDAYDRRRSGADKMLCESIKLAVERLNDFIKTTATSGGTGEDYLTGITPVAESDASVEANSSLEGHAASSTCACSPNTAFTPAT